MSAREEVLRWGLVDWVELDRTRWYVARENPGQPLPVVQDRTLDMIRSLVTDGLFDVGDLTRGVCLFRAWNITLDESIRRLQYVYEINFEDDNRWPWFCWLSLTEKGQQVAEAIEAAAGSADGRQPNRRGRWAYDVGA
jgi:hypothetical protein